MGYSVSAWKPKHLCYEFELWLTRYQYTFCIFIMLVSSSLCSSMTILFIKHFDMTEYEIARILRDNCFVFLYDGFYSKKDLFILDIYY